MGLLTGAYGGAIKVFLGFAAIVGMIGYIYNKGDTHGAARVQTKWDKDVIEQAKAQAIDAAKQAAQIEAATQSLIAASKKISAAKFQQITDIFKDEKPTDCKPSPVLIRLLND